MGINMVEDYYLGSWEGREDKSLYTFFGNFVAIFLLILFGNALRHYHFCTAEHQGYKRISRAMLARLFKAPINLYYDVTPSGKILNRLGGDVHAIRHMMESLGYQPEPGAAPYTAPDGTLVESHWYRVGADAPPPVFTPN